MLSTAAMKKSEAYRLYTTYENKKEEKGKARQSMSTSSKRTGSPPAGNLVAVLLNIITGEGPRQTVSVRQAYTQLHTQHEQHASLYVTLPFHPHATALHPTHSHHNTAQPTFLSRHSMKLHILGARARTKVVNSLMARAFSLVG